MIDRIGEPGDGEFEFPLAGFDILGVFRIPGLNPITCIRQLNPQPRTSETACRSR